MLPIISQEIAEQTLPLKVLENEQWLADVNIVLASENKNLAGVIAILATCVPDVLWMRAVLSTTAIMYKLLQEQDLVDEIERMML